MSNHVYIITGTSSGLGAELAKQLLREGHEVIGLSRTNNEEISGQRAEGKFTFYPVDLVKIETLASVIHLIISALDPSSLESITLINNAAAVTPLKEIQECTEEEISKNVHVNITAPLLLTSAFIRLTTDWDATRRVVNISSGSAMYPAPSMSLYCSAKAALNMFSRCVGLEQKQATNAVQVFAIDPGMMDTGMQQTARESDMALSAFFAAQKVQGYLSDPAHVARQIMNLINSPLPQNGDVYQVHGVE